jgi:hypothetical protein
MNEVARSEVLGFATYAGAIQAHVDFGNGVRRQYELFAESGAGISRRGFSGRHDGTSEIWQWTYYPSLGQNHWFANRTFVDMYNSKMKFMRQHLEQFQPDEMGAHNSEQRSN